MLLHMTVKRAESLVFFTFSSFQSLMVSDCASEALRFLCSHIRRRFEAAWTQNQCSLCWGEVVKQWNSKSMGGLAKFLVVKSSQNQFGMKWGNYYGVILSKLSRMCSCASADSGFAQPLFGYSHSVILVFQWVWRKTEGKKNCEHS